jgi:hypothetical protein
MIEILEYAVGICGAYFLCGFLPQAFCYYINDDKGKRDMMIYACIFGNFPFIVTLFTVEHLKKKVKLWKKNIL